MRTSEILDKAADLIEERGWGRGVQTWKDNGGGLCIEGGIAAAAGFDFDTSPPSALKACPAYRAVCEHLDMPSKVWRWNDQKERTASEVIEVLRACALIESAKEAAEGQEKAYASYRWNITVSSC